MAALVDVLLGVDTKCLLRKFRDEKELLKATTTGDKDAAAAATATIEMIEWTVRFMASLDGVLCDGREDVVMAVLERLEEL